MQTLGDGLAVGIFVVYLALSLAYGLSAPWWRSQVGRNYLAMPIVICLTFALASVTVIWGVNWSARPWVRALIFCLILVIGIWRLWIVATRQITRRSEEKDHEAQS